MVTAHATETHYEEQRDYVLAALARRCGWLERSDREAIFHDAYALLLENQRAGKLDLDSMHPRQVAAYLAQTALHKALDEGKRAERRRSEPLGDREFTEPDPAASPEDSVAADMDSLPVREIVAELPERRRAIVKLRFYFDRTPEEIQTFLGITGRVYRRELERALKQVAERYEIVRAGAWCDTRRSLVRAYVAGISGSHRAAEARAHIDACPGCASYATQLRVAAQRAAAAIPLPLLPFDAPQFSRLVEAIHAARDTLADALTGAKQHATAVAVRTDPGSVGYASAVRPGAVAAAVASCIAVGGGATYCVVEGVPQPIRGLMASPRERPEPKRDRSPKAERPKGAAAPARSEARAPKPAPEPPKVAKQRRKRPDPTRTPAPTTAPATTAADIEFGPETAPAAATTPAPAPPGEFDP